MACEPVNWVSWPEAWSRMSDIWDGWRYDPDRRNQAFVNALRLRPVNYRGDVREIDPYLGLALPVSRIEFSLDPRPKPLRLEDVVRGLLKVSFLFGAQAEYQRERWDTPSTFYRSPFQSAPRLILETAKADVSSAELAWEEFRNALRRYELPPGAVPNPDPAEASTDHRNQRTGTTTPVSRSNKKKRRAYERRVKEFRKLDRTPPVQDTVDGKTQGDRQWAVANGVSRGEITKWRHEILGTVARGRPKNPTRK